MVTDTIFAYVHNAEREAALTSSASRLPALSVSQNLFISLLVRTTVARVSGSLDSTPESYHVGDDRGA